MIMLHYVARRIKVADEIKVANYLVLKLGDYPGLFVTSNVVVREERHRKISVQVMRFETSPIAGFENRRE